MVLLAHYVDIVLAIERVKVKNFRIMCGKNNASAVRIRALFLKKCENEVHEFLVQMAFNFVDDKIASVFQRFNRADNQALSADCASRNHEIQRKWIWSFVLTLVIFEFQAPFEFGVNGQAFDTFVEQFQDLRRRTSAVDHDIQIIKH